MIAITTYKPQYHNGVVDLVISIQQKEFQVPITYEQQPDLQDIFSFFDMFWIALYEDKVVGTIGMKQIDNFALIRKMFVKQEFRGPFFSIAQKLLQSLEIECQSRNVEDIYLGTVDTLKAAHRFYEKNSYLEITKDGLPAKFPLMKVDTKFYSKKLPIEVA